MSQVGDPIPALGRAVQTLVDIDPAMTLRSLHAFLTVARDPGKSMTEYQKVLGWPMQTTSRILLDLSHGRRVTQTGPRLLERHENPDNLREVTYRPSVRGTALLRRLGV